MSDISINGHKRRHKRPKKQLSVRTKAGISPDSLCAVQSVTSNEAHDCTVLDVDSEFWDFS